METSPRRKDGVYGLEALKGFDHLKHDTHMTVLSLTTPKSSIVTSFQELIYKQYTKDNVPVIYRTRDISTQTEDPHLEEALISSTELEDDNYPLPACEFCHQPTDVYGPCGLKRDRHFGKYYLQCKQCLNGLNKRKFFRIGITPRHPSKSKKPRNLLAIQTFINNY